MPNSIFTAAVPHACGMVVFRQRDLTCAVVSLALALGLSSSAVRGQEHTEYSAADAAAGARVYGAMCLSCHGTNGAGVGGIDLRRSPLPRAGTDAALRSVVITGFPASGMPAFRLDPDELRALVAFIRTGSDAGAKPATVALGDVDRGRLVFETEGKCLTCHRVGDRGAYSGPDLTEIGRTCTAVMIQRSPPDPTGSMRPINRPVEAVTNTGRVIRGRRLNEDMYTVQLQDDQGRLVSLVKSDLRKWTVATTSPMPSYGDKLTAAALADLVAYLMSLSGSRP